jgi:hypothetical protein
LKNVTASPTSLFGSAWKPALSVSMAITPDHLAFAISAKRSL